jgi:hypothetical protein
MTTAAPAPEPDLGRLRLAEDNNDTASAPSTSQSTPPTPTPTTRPPPTIRAFSERAPDDSAVLHYQLVDLGKQLYVWIGGGGAGLPTVPNLHFAIQSGSSSLSSSDPTPAVAALLPERDAAGRAEALSRRLARRLGRPVLLSCALPVGCDPLLHALAEKRLLQELKDMGLLAVPAGGAGGAKAAAVTAG